MNASPAPVPESRLQVVLGELLHSLSQPLTSLHCALELSINPVAEQQRKAVSAALEQLDRAIHVVELMRECLEAEPAGSGPRSGIALKAQSRGPRTPESKARECQPGAVVRRDMRQGVPRTTR
ncbi:MAG: hypothetical protein ACHP78_15925 [Terriglobales bacterium]